MLPPLAAKGLMVGSGLGAGANDFDCHGELDLRMEPCRYLVGPEALDGFI